MKLKCQCCGHEAEFADGEAAFDAGWDAPPHFNQHVCCNLCPAVCVVMGAGHTKAHAHWAKEGRPDDFTLGTCATDEHFGNKPREASVQADMDGLRHLIEDMEKMLGLKK